MRPIALTEDVVMVGEFVALYTDAGGTKANDHIRFQCLGYKRIEFRAVKIDWDHDATDASSQTSTE